ncbi:hypothetical protein J7297_02501 [Nakaseomyces glabratus]|nr:hypothetical protein J7297_02501 [Nakaseomyces glabratus]KAH7592397.1 hypothetical protein J7296_02499 [Nakaseomyces glabratus]
MEMLLRDRNGRKRRSSAGAGSGGSGVGAVGGVGGGSGSGAENRVRKVRFSETVQCMAVDGAGVVRALSDVVLSDCVSVEYTLSGRRSGVRRRYEYNRVVTYGDIEDFLPGEAVDQGLLQPPLGAVHVEAIHLGSVPKTAVVVGENEVVDVPRDAMAGIDILLSADSSAETLSLRRTPRSSSIRLTGAAAGLKRSASLSPRSLYNSTFIFNSDDDIDADGTDSDTGIDTEAETERNADTDTDIDDPTAKNPYPATQASLQPLAHDRNATAGPPPDVLN